MNKAVINLFAVLSLISLVSCANYDGRSMKGKNPTDTLDVLVDPDFGTENEEKFPENTDADPEDSEKNGDQQKGEVNPDLDPFQGVGNDSTIGAETLSGMIGEAGSYELTFPQISDTPSDFAINGTIQAIADRIYLDFATEIAEMSAEGSQIGTSELVGEGRIIFNNGYLLSVLFEGLTYWGGAASQQSWSDSVMVDLSNGQTLTAENLFQQEISIEWKEVIANKSYELLVERLGSEMVWDEGLIPNAENFDNMLLHSPGFLSFLINTKLRRGWPEHQP